MLLHFGYRGKYYEQIDNCPKKAGLLSLTMQSPNGEMPFGGRSNQFLHNETWMAAIFEYEANRNGHYRVFLATAQNALNVKIEITKA